MTDGYTLGAQKTDTLTGRVIIVVACGGKANTGVTLTLKKGSANYQVTAGKTFYITGVTWGISVANTALSYYELRYSDDAAGTTNPVTLATFPTGANAAFSPVFLPIAGISAPAQKYLHIFNNSGTSDAAGTSMWIVFGYEA
jgi:hypothetical protein